MTESVMESKPMQDLSNKSARDVVNLRGRAMARSRRLSSKRIAVGGSNKKVKPSQETEGDGLKTAFYRLGVDLGKQSSTTPKNRPQSPSMRAYESDDVHDQFLLQRPRSETAMSVETPDTIAEVGRPPSSRCRRASLRRKLNLNAPVEYDEDLEYHDNDDCQYYAAPARVAGTPPSTKADDVRSPHSNSCLLAFVIGGLFACVGIAPNAWNGAAARPRSFHQGASFDSSPVAKRRHRTASNVVAAAYPEALARPTFSPSPIG